MKKVTVIIPFYELTSDIVRSLTSISRQSIANDVQILLIDLRKFINTDKIYKSESGNVPEFVTTDAKAKKQKNVYEYISKYIDTEIQVFSDGKTPYELFDETISSSDGEYTIFNVSNSILTKDILSILYTFAKEKNADIVIGNSAKQKGKKTPKSNIGNKVYGNDENTDFSYSLNTILNDNSLYNKFIKTKLIKSSKATFKLYNAPKNFGFLIPVFTAAEKVLYINREIYVCDFKKIYEYTPKKTVQYWCEYADTLIDTIKSTSWCNDADYPKQLVFKYTEPFFKYAQNSVKADIRSKCGEVYRAATDSEYLKKYISQLAKEYPVAVNKYYNLPKLFLLKLKNRLFKVNNR